MRVFARIGLLSLTACNQWFSIENTQLPPPDAPASCPSIGTAPVFSPTFHQFAVQPCTAYSPSTDARTALAACPGPKSPFIAFGPLDQPLMPVDFPPVNQSVNLEKPRLVPEGDVAYVTENNFDINGGNKLTAYRQVNETAWTIANDLALPLPPTYGLEAGTPTRGPMRHMMVWDTSGSEPWLHELVGTDSGPWTEVLPSYISNSLGPSMMTVPNMTADGLRIIFSGVDVGATMTSVYYADRPSIDARFGHAQLLEGVPNVQDAYMTETCSRVYFSGLGSLLYVER